jgi:hypothetical protein
MNPQLVYSYHIPLAVVLLMITVLLILETSLRRK